MRNKLTRMLVVLTVILSPASKAECEDVVRACDNVLLKQSEFIQIVQDRNTDLDNRLQELSINYEKNKSLQLPLFLSGATIGALLVIFLRPK